MTVADNHELYGLGVAFEPYAFDPAQLYFAPYYAREKKGLVLTYMGMGHETYRYFYEDWYQIPRELKASGLDRAVFRRSNDGDLFGPVL